MAVSITVDPHEKHQRMEGFGASGAWWAQYVGALTEPDPQSGKPVRDRIAELLYNPQTGLGMQTFRYNLGAGSDSGRGTIDNPLMGRCANRLTRPGVRALMGRKR